MLRLFYIMKDFLKHKLREGYNNILDEESDSYHIDIERETLENDNYRKVLYTTDQQQLVLMSLKPEEEIGEENHPDTTQFIRIEAGNGKAIMNDKEVDLKDGMSVVVPAGTKHNIINTSEDEPLKLYTIYSPPHHDKDTIEADKPNAETD